MWRNYKIVLALVAVCGGAVAACIIRSQPFASNFPKATILQKGVFAAPSAAEALVGTYYIGDGTGYNIYLTLTADRSFSADFYGCFGKYGDANGHWSINSGEINFVSLRETGMMKGNLGAMDILKFQGHWIFLEKSKNARNDYNAYGVSPSVCFQNTNNIFWGP